MASPALPVDRGRVIGAQATGAAGTVLIALSSVSTGAWPVDVDPSESPVLGRLAELPAVALSGALVGMGLLVMGWLSLGGFAFTDRPAVPVRRLYLTLAVWALPLLVVPPMFSADLYSYLAQGAIADRGMDPYTLGPVDALGPDDELAENVSDYWAHTPAPYGPLFMLILQGIHQIAGDDILLGVVLNRLVELVGVGLIVWVLPRLVRRAGARLETAVWLGALNPLLLLHLIAGMHNDGLMIGLLLAGVEVGLGALQGERIAPVRLAAGVALIVLAASVKLPAVVALAVLGVVLARRWGGRMRHLLAAGATMLVAYLALTAAVSFATGFGLAWIDGLHTPGAVNSWMAPTNQFGFLVGGIGGLLGFDITQTAIGVGKVIGAVVGLLLVGVLVLRMLRGVLAPLYGLGLLLAVAVVCGPVVQPWYLLWAAIPLGASAIAARRVKLLAAACAACAVVVPPLGSSLHGNVAGIALAYAVAVAVLATVYVGGRLLLRPAAGG